jgi:hypothetical protein
MEQMEKKQTNNVEQKHEGRERKKRKRKRKRKSDPQFSR